MAVELPELSAKICSLYGMHRSQYVTAATHEIIESITGMLHDVSSRVWSDVDQCYHLSAGIPAEVVYDVSELCVSLINNDEATPLVEALLGCSIAAPSPGSAKHGLSPQFVHSVQDIIHKLSYQAKLALWMKELSAFENHVMCTIRPVLHPANGDLTDSEVEDVLSNSQLPQACCTCPHFFYHIREILKAQLVVSSGAKTVTHLVKVFHNLFKQELGSNHSQQPVLLSLYSYYPTYLHPLLQLVTISTCDYDQLWAHIKQLLVTNGNNINPLL
ncbi:Fanconi anemia group C protein-like isoform X2 [Dysidea avara]|uniref:Fanconi anemia group C protein-like isoform X2 n=1 Tax=Dysidea avara TaxID=196820 RepID=UPI003332C0AD